MSKKSLFESKPVVLIGGLVIGGLAALLAANGNPGNMAFCIACFIRDIAGSVKLHQAAVVQYFRPEIVGLVVGSFVVAVATKEFKVTSGSSPLTRFLLGVCTAILALIFLGCPLRMLIRMSAGDLNAYVACVGFVLGIAGGAFFLKKGYELTDEKEEETKVAGFIMPVALLLILFLTLNEATKAMFAFSESGPGSMHAPAIMSLVVALIIGGIALKSKTCFAGSIRNAIFTKDPTSFLSILGIFIALLVYNLVAGKFKLSFTEQPVAHNDHLFNFISMFGVGLAATFAGGCPLRQLILTGKGGTDNAANVIGMLLGAAIAHNFGLASSANGTTPAGRVATFVCLVIVLVIGVTNTRKS